MASTYDFAIFGGNALGSLVAGLLAHDHNKQVLLIADPISPQRLPRGIDLALLVASRPQSWKMLRRGVAETTALMASLGAQRAVEMVDVRLTADLPQAKTALAHVAATARGYGQPSQGEIFHSVPRLSAPISLADSRVVTIERDAARLEFTRGGVAQLAVSGELADVSQIVIADDAALLDLLPPDQRPLQLTLQSMTATLTAPARKLPTPVVIYPDRGVTLQQRPDLSVLALVSGDSDVEARLASTLPGPFPLQRLATTHFRRVATSDGAPMIGRVKPSRLMVLTGLDAAAAFFAPIVARHLAGVPADDEKPWIASLSPSRPREAITDFVAGIA
jgi:hypothetical protein